jgi:glycosyltransferase A (GT-A) superfamily protein (DUF2064 family)
VTAASPEPATTLLVIAKQPLPGLVKTRLVPPCSYEQAAALAVAVARQAPRTRFAARARELATVLSPAGSITEGSILGVTP